MTYAEDLTPSSNDRHVLVIKSERGGLNRAISECSNWGREIWIQIGVR